MDQRSSVRDQIAGTGPADHPPTQNPKWGGFTLLEVVVSLAVLGVAIALAMQLFSRSLQNVRMTGEHTIAISHADSLMNELLLDEEIKGAAERSGVFDDGYRWRAVIGEVVDPLTTEERLRQPQELPAKKLALSVTIYWGTARKENSFRLDTVKLVENERYQGRGAFPQQPGTPAPGAPPPPPPPPGASGRGAFPQQPGTLPPPPRRPLR